jgi:hypothetical protein
VKLTAQKRLDTASSLPVKHTAKKRQDMASKSPGAMARE